IEVLRDLDLANRFFTSAHRREEASVPMMGRGVVWLELNCAQEFLFGASEIPIELKFRIGETRVSLGQFAINFQSSQRRTSSARKAFSGRLPVIISQQQIRVGQSGVSRRICRIEIDRLLKKFYGLVHLFFGAFVPGVASAKISMKCFRVIGVSAGKLSMFLGRELQLQSLCNVPRNILFGIKQPGEFLIER